MAELEGEASDAGYAVLSWRETALGQPGDVAREWGADAVVTVELQPADQAIDGEVGTADVTWDWQKLMFEGPDWKPLPVEDRSGLGPRCAELFTRRADQPVTGAALSVSVNPTDAGSEAYWRYDRFVVADGGVLQLQQMRRVQSAARLNPWYFTIGGGYAVGVLGLVLYGVYSQGLDSYTHPIALGSLAGGALGVAVALLAEHVIGVNQFIVGYDRAEDVLCQPGADPHFAHEHPRLGPDERALAGTSRDVARTAMTALSRARWDAVATLEARR